MGKKLEHREGKREIDPSVIIIVLLCTFIPLLSGLIKNPSVFPLSPLCTCTYTYTRREIVSSAPDTRRGFVASAGPPPPPMYTFINLSTIPCPHHPRPRLDPPDQKVFKKNSLNSSIYKDTIGY